MRAPVSTLPVRFDDASVIVGSVTILNSLSLTLTSGMPTVLIGPNGSGIRYAKIHGTKHRPWLTALLARRPTKVVAIALANKIARMVWAMMAKGERYKEPVALAA